MRRRYHIQELIIQQKKSFWHYAMAVLLLMLISYGLGHFYAKYQYNHWGKEKETLTQQLDKLHTQFVKHTKYIQELERSKEISKQSVELLKITNQNLQNTINELQTDLSFYRRVLGPTQNNGASVAIAEVKWGAKEQKNHYRYRLVLMQSGTNHEWQEGDLQMAVMGIQENKKAKFFVKEKSRPALSYRFRYFQNLEGNVVLPENFIPEGVEITLLPHKSGGAEIKETFAWKLEGNDYVENKTQTTSHPVT